MHKGEVWLINLDPTVGAEIQKTRPAVIVNQDAMGVLPLRVIVPLTDWKDRYSIPPWMVRIEPDATNGLNKSSAADAFQIRSVSLEKLTNRMGRVSDKALREILKAVKIVIGA